MTTKSIIIALVVAGAASCTAQQRPYVDLEPEQLVVEIDASAPISVTCTHGLPCSASAYGDASVAIGGEGMLRIGDILIPGVVTVDAAVSVESTPDGPVTSADAEICFFDRSKLLTALLGFDGPICYSVTRDE